LLQFWVVLLACEHEFCGVLNDYEEKYLRIFAKLSIYNSNLFSSAYSEYYHSSDHKSMTGAAVY